MSRVARSVERRKEIAKSYLDALEGVPGISFQAESDAGGENGYWVVGTALSNHPKFDSAKDAMRALGEAGSSISNW